MEKITINSLTFSRPSPRPPLRSRQMGRVNRIDQIRQPNRTRERAAKTQFVAARISSRIEGHAQLLEALRRCRLSKPAKAQATAKLGVLAVNGGKPSLFKSKKDIVGLPGLFDGDLLAELTEEDKFLGPMKCAIISKDVTSFNKLGSYMAQFWTKATVVSDCVIVDNKLAIPEPLRKVVLARLHRSQPLSTLVAFFESTIFLIPAKIVPNARCLVRTLSLLMHLTRQIISLLYRVLIMNFS